MRFIRGSTVDAKHDKGRMSAKFGHHPWTVEELVSGVDKGTIRLPDIQRPFVWPNAKVRDLIDSMYRGYPVGELMFWANKDATTPVRSVRTPRRRTRQCRWSTVSSG